LGFPLPDTCRQSLLRRLAEQIRVVGSGDLLMSLRKHSDHKTRRFVLLFPRPRLSW